MARENFDFAKLLDRRGSLFLREQLEALDLLETCRRNGVRISVGGAPCRIEVFLASVKASRTTLAEATRVTADRTGKETG